MNILFVHHGSFSANSMNHIGPFAAELRKLGHNSIITLPELDPSFKFFPYPQVPVYSYDDFLQNPSRFGTEPPDIVHAWTPREVVRQFCENLWQMVPARIIVHLEDDEWAVDQHIHPNEREILARTDHSHGPVFLEIADAYTVIMESLEKELHSSKPVHCLHPGWEGPKNGKNNNVRISKHSLGIPQEYKVITYPGSASKANSEDLLDLFQAVNLLNQHGTPCMLLKTGFPDLAIRNKLKADAQNWIRDLGFVPREHVWKFIELADVVVQPGRINEYNQHRLPSKLPDYLCSGKPLVTTSANLGKYLEDGNHALLLKHSTPEEITARCQELFSNQALANQIAESGRQFGEQWFNTTRNTSNLESFYETVLGTPQDQLSRAPGNQIGKLVHVLQEELKDISPPTSQTLRYRSYIKSVAKNASTNSKSGLNGQSALEVEFHIYYPNEPEQLEISSLRRWYKPRQPQQWLIPFSPPQDLEWIRMDPGQFPGTFYLKSWAFLDAHRNPLFRWEPGSDKSISCQLTGATLGPVTEEGQEIWSLTHDPQILFANLPAIDNERVRWMSLEFSASEIESPLRTPLRLKRKQNFEKDENWQETLFTIESLLRNLERRRSPVVRFFDRLRQKIKD